METSYYRDVAGWNGLTLVDLGDGRVLRFLTARREADHKLVSTVTCYPKGDFAATTRTRSIDDFHLVAVISKPACTTEALVRKQHDLVLSKLEMIRDLLRRHDKLQTRKGA